MDIKPTQGKRPLGDGMHGEVHWRHLNTVSIRRVGEARAEDVQGCCEFARGVFNHQHGQSVAAVTGVTFTFNVNQSVLVNIVADLVIGRDEYPVLRAFTDQHELLNRTITVHVPKVYGPGGSPRFEHGRGLVAHVVVIIPSTGDGVSRHVARWCCRIAVRVSWIGNQQVSSKVKIVIKNRSVGQREEDVVVIAVPSKWASVLDGTVAGRTRRENVKVLVAVKITNEGPLTDA